MTEQSRENQAPRPVPSRFLVSKSTLRFDQFMTSSIVFGGLAIIVAVFAIFAYILSQVMPLFKSASVDKAADFTLQGDQAALVLGVDEWSELPFVYRGGAQLEYRDVQGDRGVFKEELEIPEQQMTAFRYSPKNEMLALGFESGEFAIVNVSYEPIFKEGVRTIEPKVETILEGDFEMEGYSVIDIGYGATEEERIVCAVLRNAAGETQVVAKTFEQTSGLMGPGELEEKDSFDLTQEVPSGAHDILVSSSADSVIVSNKAGKVTYLFYEDEEFNKRQVFQPFEEGFARMDYILGNVSVVFTTSTGEQETYSLYLKKGEKNRTFGKTKSFPSVGVSPSFFVPSSRNKAFLVGAGNTVSLRYNTTERIRWEKELDFEPRLAAIDGKYKTIWFLDTEDQLQQFKIDDPHPDAGLKAFVGKIWYEGKSEPEYDWQSTGGSDEFEPKLSLVPLFIGSLKGTLYALMFAIPIALLAAIYTSQFLSYKAKRIVKPTMEIMASLPSVVLGFLAALWLAPIMEYRVPSFLLCVVGIPLSAIMVGYLWSQLPSNIRNFFEGWEWLVVFPVLALASIILWNLGPAAEQLLFKIKEYQILAADGSLLEVVQGAGVAKEKIALLADEGVQATYQLLGNVQGKDGRAVADFTLWWSKQVSLGAYDQRNSLVVGFMMGFAVIPIIFTIAEDALSNVPSSLRAASSALGASRWQTVKEVVLPIASAGIFSAIMIGFGRAVGETMVVVMATGNTPVMDWNIFNGMRTLAANLAVELPEAPKASTHYRALFLGAFVLFILTFTVNTIAEVLRQHLREKYKIV